MVWAKHWHKEEHMKPRNFKSYSSTDGSNPSILTVELEPNKQAYTTEYNLDTD